MDKLFPHDFKFVYLPPQPVTCYPPRMWPGYLSFRLLSSILRMCNWRLKTNLQIFILIDKPSLAMLVKNPDLKFQFLLQWHQGSNFDTFIPEIFVFLNLHRKRYCASSNCRSTIWREFPPHLTNWRHHSFSPRWYSLPTHHPLKIYFVKFNLPSSYFKYKTGMIKCILYF